MPIRAILFDKDGTLIDFQCTWGPATHAVLTHLAGRDSARFERMAEVGGFIVAKQRFHGDSLLIAGSTPEFGTLWAKILGVAPTREFFAEIDRLYSEFGLEHLTPIGDPADVFVALRRRGYRLGIATNDAQAGTLAQIARLGIGMLIDFVAGYDSGFGEKPGPGQVLAFARAVGINVRDVAMVGDAIHDLAAARAAGALAIGVRSGPIPAEQLIPYADVLLDSIADLPTWLEQNP